MRIRHIEPRAMTPGRVTPLLVIALGFTFILAAGAADLELTVGGFTGGGGSSSDGDLEHIGSLGDASAGTVRGGTLVLSGGVVAGGGDPSFIFSEASTILQMSLGSDGGCGVSDMRPSLRGPRVDNSGNLP